MRRLGPSSNRILVLANRYYYIAPFFKSSINLYYLFSFTLYPVYRRVSRGNLVLRYSVLHFPPHFRGTECWVAELNAAFLAWNQSEEIKMLISNNSFPLCGDRNPQPSRYNYTLTPLNILWGKKRNFRPRKDNFFIHTFHEVAFGPIIITCY